MNGRDVRLSEQNDDDSRNLGDSALLIIDMQICQVRESAISHAYQASGQDPSWYLERSKHEIEPNISRLIRLFANRSNTIVFTRFVSSVADQTDVPAPLRTEERTIAPEDRIVPIPTDPGAEILPKLLASCTSSIVVDKNGCSAFEGTNLDRILRIRGISNLFVCGVFAELCVESTVRQAFDKGFTTTVIEDACGSIDPDLQRNSLKVLRQLFCSTASVADVEEIFMSI